MLMTDGFVKILACDKTDKVLGVHILGPDAGHLITEASDYDRVWWFRRRYCAHMPCPSNFERGCERGCDGRIQIRYTFLN